MSGYLVLICYFFFFFFSSKTLEFLQERDFETETFLCLDWNNAPWVCSSFSPPPFFFYLLFAFKLTLLCPTLTFWLCLSVPLHWGPGTQTVLLHFLLF